MMPIWYESWHLMLDAGFTAALEMASDFGLVKTTHLNLAGQCVSVCFSVWGYGTLQPNSN